MIEYSRGTEHVEFRLAYDFLTGSRGMGKGRSEKGSWKRGVRGNPKFYCLAVQANPGKALVRSESQLD